MEEELNTLCEFNSTWDLIEVVVVRSASGCPLNIKLTFTNKLENKSLELIGCKESDSIENLLEADRIRISKIAGSQLEFGSICVECFSDAYCYFTCDGLA